MSTQPHEWVAGGIVPEKPAGSALDSAGERFDVAILGAGFEGAIVALLLAAKGAKVLLLDAGIHPRFALGESTVRHTFRMLRIMGERFDIPEIREKFSSGEAVHKHVTSACGEKRNFGFIYHREGRHQIPAEANQLVIPPFREGYEAHLFRQDIDTFLTNTAIHYGVTVRYRTLISDVSIARDGATLKGSKGEEFRARFVVDASGSNSVLGRLFKLREEPPRFKLASRCLFTHMIDVKHYDDLELPDGVPRMPEQWYNGTCHHIFDGGWLWVIPFDNRRGSTNPIVSVGVSFDLKKFPKPKDLTPEQEWQQFLSRFPSIYEQFKDAKAVRDWVSSDRLQVSCKQCVGERFFLMASCYGSGFIDALFSRGLANSVEVVNALVPRLLKALQDDDFSPQRFEYLERLQANLIANNDKLVNSAYICFRDYDLWNAWFRIWALGVGLGDLRLASIYRRYLKTRDDSILPDAEEPMALFYSNHAGFKKVFDAACAEAQAVDEGRLDAKEAARRIFQLLAAVDFSPPANRLGDPAMRCINAGAPITLLRTVGWLLTSAPSDIRKLTLGVFADWGPSSRKISPSAA